MTYTARDQWKEHFSDGKNFRQLGERERELLAEHTPVPNVGGRALDVGCGTGCVGRDRVPRRACRFTWRRSSACLSHDDGSQCPFSDPAA